MNESHSSPEPPPVVESFEQWHARECPNAPWKHLSAYRWTESFQRFADRTCREVYEAEKGGAGGVIPPEGGLPISTSAQAGIPNPALPDSSRAGAKAPRRGIHFSPDAPPDVLAALRACRDALREAAVIDRNYDATALYAALELADAVLGSDCREGK